jgi:hypothetical protein
VSAYTLTVLADATATIRSRTCALLRLRLIAAARFAASVAVVADIAKVVPVFVAPAVKVSVAAAPTAGVMVMAKVWPPAGAAVKVPTILARVFPVNALMGNTAKSLSQFGAAFISKLYLAGYIPCATPPAPSEMAQSVWLPGCC